MNHEDEVDHEEHAAVDAMVREEQEAELEPSPLGATPWHGCLISFMVRRSALERAPDLYLQTLPKGWELHSGKPVGYTWAKMEFTVEGDVKREDGETVKRIMTELGMMG